jgi:hypothetical protein
MGTVSAIDVSKNLSGIDFPADKTHLVEYARSRNAGEDVIHVLEKMPEREYRTMADVEKGFGELH